MNLRTLLFLMPLALSGNYVTIQAQNPQVVGQSENKKMYGNSKRYRW